MNQYNFNVLTWEEFEEFTKDLLTAELNIPFQSFANGPDGGIDLRHSTGGDKRDIVVQCKRYKDVSSLMSSLAKERIKLDAMVPKPKRYVLSVSLDLSETKVNEIVKLFSPYLLSADDVLIPKQLNSILSRHQNVERRHYKLWLASSNVLQTILSSRVVNYTGLIKESIENTLMLYSPTPSFGEAMNALKENGFIVIAGEPGVGKTTLAQVMSFHLLGDKDFDELIALPQDINDALEMMSSDPEKKQLFLFDDFLGSNYLNDKLSRREDSVFKTLIENVGHLKKNKALIMTTREYILHQAQQSTEVFQDQNFLDGKYIISLSKYDAPTKARILYNHLASSDIPEAHLRYFVNEKVYRAIINHRNYSPRLISAINKQKLWMNRTPEAFSDQVINLFNNPWTLYEDIYMNKIDEKERNIMLVMMSIGRKIRLDHFHKAVVAFDPTIDETQLSRSIDILENTFLKTSKDKDDQIVVNVLNPTIYDFVTHYHRHHFHSLQRLIKSAMYLNQLTYAFAINKDSISYTMRSSLSGYQPILLDAASTTVFRDKVLADWRDLVWIGDDATAEEFDIFDSLSRLFDSAIEIEAVKVELSKSLLADLEKSAIPTNDVQSALNIFDYYYDSDDISEVVATNFVESIASSFMNYDDLKAAAELSWSYDMKGQISDMIVDRMSSDDQVIDILDEEIRQRLSDDEDDQSIKEEMGDTLSYFGLGSGFVDEVFDSWSEPPEDYGDSSFYSRDDDDFESHRDVESDQDTAIDNIFESLISK